MTTAEKEKIITKNMKILNLTRAEREQLLADDLRVDRMSMAEINATYSADEKAVIKKMTATGTRKAPTVYKFDKRERKTDTEKADFVQNLAEFIQNYAENVQIVNKEREISFTIGENSYSLTLTKHRNAKK